MNIKSSIKYSVIIILIIGFSNLLQANTIKGRIIDSDSNSIELVNIKISELKKQTNSDVNGFFKFDNIKSGVYTFSLSRAGIGKLDTTIIISTDTTLIFKLQNIGNWTDDIIVTGTRREKVIASCPIATQVISNSEIKAISAHSLSDILSVNSSLNLINSHGKGVQLQGLDPAYTTIMIDGNPLIGREGGTLDLDRINLSNIKRIEIIKGAASSRYGSTALAGVINIITDEPINTFGLNTGFKYEQCRAYSLNAVISNNLFDNNLKNSFSTDYSYNDGYSNNDLNLGLIIPKSHNLIFQNTATMYFPGEIKSNVFARYNYLKQENSYTSNNNGISTKTNDEGILNDLMLGAAITKTFDEFDISIKYNYNNYSTLIQYFNGESLVLESQDLFHQYLNKLEGIGNFRIINNTAISYGIGLEYEKVNADRIVMNNDKSTLFYTFLQADYFPNDYLDIILSCRYDKHSDYKDKISPKFAFSYQLIDNFHLKASLGAGFKAPTFQQLYMNWNNPQVGYSVFGTAFYQNGIDELKQQGLLINETIKYDKIEKLLPESSISINIGLNYTGEILSANLNIFRNNLNDMIDVLPVAQRTNGQQVFSYFNLNKVHTQGIETEFEIKIYKDIKLSLSYQYLSALDDGVIDRIEKNEIFKLGSNGIFRPVKKSEYGGLFNRSPHSASLKLYYDLKQFGLGLILQGIYKSKYGFEDTNSNSILDDDSEYASAYSLWDLYVNYDLSDKIKIKGGIKNLFNYTNDKFLVYNVGFNSFISCVINFSIL